MLTQNDIDRKLYKPPNESTGVQGFVIRLTMTVELISGLVKGLEKLIITIVEGTKHIVYQLVVLASLLFAFGTLYYSKVEHIVQAILDYLSKLFSLIA